MPRLLLALVFASLLRAETLNLLADTSLSAWDRVGPGLWYVLKDGTLVGERDLRLPPTGTSPDQAWLYTKREYGEFTLSLEYWTRAGGNSGVSIRDKTRGHYSYGSQADRARTPSHNGYEIQISNGYKDEYPTGSVYLFVKAKDGHQRSNDWNRLEVESRKDLIRVKLNGTVVAEHAGDPQRPTSGPIGLQLHDRHSLVMFRSVTLTEGAARR